MEEHEKDFPRREVDALKKKFSMIHRRKAPTGNPIVPQEVQLAKRCKKMIGDRALLGGGEEIYDMEGGGSFLSETGERLEHPVRSVLFPPSGNDDTDNSLPSAAFATPDSSCVTSRSARGRGGNRGGGKRPDPMTLMMMQMREDRLVRAEDREIRKTEENARIEDRRVMVELIGTIAGRYFGDNSKKEAKEAKAKRRRKRKRRKRSKRLGVINSSSSSSSSDNSSESD